MVSLVCTFPGLPVRFGISTWYDLTLNISISWLPVVVLRPCVLSAMNFTSLLLSVFSSWLGSHVVETLWIQLRALPGGTVSHETP